MTRRKLRTSTSALMVALLVAIAPRAAAATRYVADIGSDGPGCGIALTSACRSITQAIALAATGDTVLVGPGRYGDLNRNGVLGEAGEENGSAGCSCVLLVDKAIIVISSGGAAVTMIDGRKVNVTIRNVMIADDGAEFGRPGKGFTVTETAYEPFPGLYDSDGIVIAANSVMVRGNQVLFTNDFKVRDGRGIHTGNQLHSVRIEGNLATGWKTGIEGGQGITVSKNQVMDNSAGIEADGGTVIGNVAVNNLGGIMVSGVASATGNAAYANLNIGFQVTGPFSGVFTRNNMFGNDCGLFNLAVVDLAATNNYWGSPTGPGAGAADPVCHGSGGTTDVTPFATRPFTVKPLKP